MLRHGLAVFASTILFAAIVTAPMFSTAEGRIPVSACTKQDTTSFSPLYQDGFLIDVNPATAANARQQLALTGCSPIQSSAPEPFFS